jgi:hypothetical protein
MSENQTNNFENINLSEDKFDIFKNSIKPSDSTIDSENENLIQSVEEINIGESENETIRKLFIENIKIQLNEKMYNNKNNVVRANEFSHFLKNKYGESVYDSALYHALVGSSYEKEHEINDFEGEDSIVGFIENL